MKRLSLPLACVVLGVLPGCYDLGEFDVRRRIPEQRVEGNPLAGLLGDLFSVPVPLDVDMAAETAAHDTGPAKSAHLSALWLDVTDTARSGDTDTDDFGFLRSVDVFVESTLSGSSLPRVLVAQAHDIEPTEHLEFEVEDSIDVLPYADEGSRFVSEVEATAPADDVSFGGRFTLRVEVF